MSLQKEAFEAVRAHIAVKWQESFATLNRAEPGISGLLAFSDAWRTVLDVLRPRPLGEPRPSIDDCKIDVAHAVIDQAKRLSALQDQFLHDVATRFAIIEEDINAHMKLYEESSDPSTIHDLIHRLGLYYDAWRPPPQFSRFISFSAYALTFQTHLFSALPEAFPAAFRALCESTLNSDTAHLPDPAQEAIWGVFHALGLITRYESLISGVAYERIELHVLETCTGEWEAPMLERLRDWSARHILPWMFLPYARGATSAEEAQSMMQGVGSRFEFHMTKTLCELRTKEIFDIIIDHPDSNGALLDLKECLSKIGYRNELVQALRKANQRRLLHPGADTKVILEQYVSTIRCLRVIDPSGVLLYKVADPIRRYLRERPDTIRSIVASLVGDGESGDSIVDENEPILPLQHAEIEDYTDPNWEPEPVDAGPDFRANKPSDVVSTLVSIYDSKDLFVKELQLLLAQRLLAISDGNFDKERRNIELLKVRFGEAALQVCEVMLKDMSDSKRIDQHVQSQQASIVHPTIISRHFWPALEASDMVMPGQFQELQKQYEREFTSFKPDKRLRWLPHLGTVRLELELQDRTVPVDVKPLDAAIIELFSEKGIWTVEELTARIGKVDRAVALRSLEFWVDRGVLKEDVEHTFRLLEVAEEADPNARPAATRPVDAMGESVPVISLQQQQAEQMRVYWKFIEGMLTNLGAMPLDKIQTMLKFAPGYDRTPEQLALFMEAARLERLVVVEGGMWKLNKK